MLAEDILEIDVVDEGAAQPEFAEVPDLLEMVQALADMQKRLEVLGEMLDKLAARVDELEEDDILLGAGEINYVPERLFVAESKAVALLSADPTIHEGPAIAEDIDRTISKVRKGIAGLI